MTTQFDPSWLSAHSMDWLRILLDAAVKGVVVLTLAGMLGVVLRRASAASRHLVWVLAMASLICLPALSVVLPSWRVPIIPHDLMVTHTAQFSNSGEPRFQKSDAVGAQSVSTDFGSTISESAHSVSPGPPPSTNVPLEPTSAMTAGSTGTTAPIHWSAWVLLPLAAIQVVEATPTLVAQTQAVAAEPVEDAAESTTDKPAPIKTIRQITDGFGSYSSSTVSLDGKYICEVDWDTADLVVYELATGKRRPLARRPLRNTHASRHDQRRNAQGYGIQKTSSCAIVCTHPFLLLFEPASRCAKVTGT